MKISLIISTYNSPDRLRVVFDSVLGQSRRPDEVIVADDGSTARTRQLVAEYQVKTEMPIIHVWQPDEGFRLAKIRNKAIARASGDYIIQVDGDILLHPRFVEEHEKYARPGQFSCGKRVLLGPTLSQRILSSEAPFVPSVFDSDLHNRKNAIHSPLLGRILRAAGGKKVRHRGCNMAYWRDDALAINGFDEAYEGWGFEDTDFFLRLQKLGRRPVQIANEAIAYHLWHPSNEENNPSVSKNKEILDKAAGQLGFRAQNGVDKYLSTQDNHINYSKE